LESPETTELVRRFRAGDAEAVGEFLERYGPVVRAHYRRRIGSSMRRLVDSQDLLSTIARRLCQRVMGGGVRAEDSRQLWALVYRIGNDALVDRIRILSRLQSLECEGSPFVQGLQERLSGAGQRSESEFAEELSRVLDLIESSLDRELLLRWLHGESWADAGEALGLKAPAARKRWQRLRETIARDWESQERTT
jgi:DNA-directed RNA polymerase specialized sigma24 family protein